VIGLALLFAALWQIQPKAPEGLTLTADGVLEIPAAQAVRVDRPTLTGPVAPDGRRAGAGARVEIPAVGIDASIGADLTLNASGDWLPPTYQLGRWDASAALDAEQGTTMLAGHVWVAQSPGVLANLREVSPGNQVVLVDDDGHRQEFLVTAIEEFPRDDLPSWVWGTDTGDRRLVLVTCAGQGIDNGGHRVWSRNLVVEAVPVA
jgi:hypothetical protein